MLRKHLMEQDLARREAASWEDHDLIFPAKNRRPMQPGNLYLEFKALLKKAKLPDVRFHDLRHTAANMMLQQGIHPKVVSERLGHADVSMTLSVYSHVLPAMQDQAAQKMDELLVPIEVGAEFRRIGEEEVAHHA